MQLRHCCRLYEKGKDVLLEYSRVMQMALEAHYPGWPVEGGARRESPTPPDPTPENTLNSLLHPTEDSIFAILLNTGLDSILKSLIHPTEDSILAIF